MPFFAYYLDYLSPLAAWAPLSLDAIGKRLRKSGRGLDRLIGIGENYTVELQAEFGTIIGVGMIELCFRCANGPSKFCRANIT